MKDEKACIAKHWPEAFQIAIQQSMQTVREKGKKRRTVKLSEEERMAMFHFYRQNVKDDRVMALRPSAQAPAGQPRARRCFPWPSAW